MILKKLIHNCIGRGSRPEDDQAGVGAGVDLGVEEPPCPPQQLAASATTAREHQYVCIFARYNAALIENNAVDFDDILIVMVAIFRDREDILRVWQEKFAWLFVDEYQDTNVAQNEIVRMLGEKHQNVCVVGDVDQSIYSFRGAEMENILKFTKLFPAAHTITLEQNYRSTRTILDVANALIENNELRPPKTLRTLKDGGTQIVTRTFASGVQECEWLAGQVKPTNRGTKGGDIAVLVRQKVIGRDVEKALLTRKIPCKFVGSIPFFDRKDVKTLLSYLKLLLNPNDEIAFGEW